MRFMFPADALNPRKIDEYFKPQAEVLAPEGYALFSMENHTVRGVQAEDEVLYRGWMVDAGTYRLLDTLVGAQGARMVTTPEQYVNTHYLPFWYNSIERLNVTAETMVFPLDYLESHPNQFPALVLDVVKTHGWEKFFVKDFVKSLKTGKGSVASNLEELTEVVEQMRHYRGTIEGGLCIRKFEGGLHDEQRCFVINHKYVAAFGEALTKISLETDQMLSEVASRIDSPFFTIDFALDADNKARIVELGDGQVSDLVGNWNPELLKQAFGMGLTPNGVAFSSK